MYNCKICGDCYDLEAMYVADYICAGCYLFVIQLNPTLGGIALPMKEYTMAMRPEMVEHIGGDRYRVKSEADVEKGLTHPKTYVVDLSVESCDCPWWRNHLSRYEIGSGDRWCKHMRVIRPAPSRLTNPAALQDENRQLQNNNARLLLQNEMLHLKIEQLERQLDALAESVTREALVS